MANSHEYINYIEFINYDDGTGIPSLRHHVLEYVQHKNYNNLYGDIVLVIVANALMLNILLVEQPGNTCNLHLVKPRHDIGSSILHRTLILHKKNAHYDAIRLMHESAIGGHDQWLPRCRSNIGIGNEIVGSFLLVLNPMALYATWNVLCNLISE